ncbi:porin [Pelagibaculum spongiae]|uniref:Porin domain-containing protein n=1 Tax=Pelagibaculum spongiae TaxID=2080658 RepID=A0A2V1GU19_9GAMM|nr:porin [Pelagibaculum spongiae]PVZ69509.1 hypothetical protein DC094_09270 [Pelagibaculum spongiae]
MFKKSLLAIAMFPVAAMADANITVPMELEYNNLYSAESNADEKANLFATIEPEITVGITEQLSFFGQIALEEINESENSDDRYLEDHGFYINEFKLQYDTEQFGGFIGKTGINFGTGFDAPGIFTSGFAGDYEITEQIAVGGYFNTGSISISAGVFHGDSNLDKRYIESVERSGSPDNKFASYAIAVDSEFKALTIHAAYADFDNGDNTDNTDAWVFGLGHSSEIGATELTPMLEIATDKDDINYLTAAIEVASGPISGVVGFSSTDDADDKTRQLEIAGGYALQNGLELGMAFAQKRSGNGDKTNIIGLIAAYELSYDL